MSFDQQETRNAIYRSFRPEFYKEAMAVEPGTDGSIARGMYSYEQWHKQNPLTSMGIILGVTMLSAMTGAVLLGGAGFLVGLGLLMGAIFLGATMQNHVYAKADKKIEAGIADGSLVARYKNEFLVPEIKRLEHVLTGLAEKGVLSTSFTAVVVPKADGMELPDAPTSELPRNYRR